MGAFLTRGVFLNDILGVLEHEVLFGTKGSFFKINVLVSSSDDSAVGVRNCRGLGGETTLVDVEGASGGSKMDFTLFSARMDSTAAEVSEVSMTW